MRNLMWMTKVIVLLAVAALLTGVGSSTSVYAAAPPQNVNVSKALDNQQETTIAVNPANPMLQFTASNDYSDPALKHLFTARSGDGGVNWVPGPKFDGTDGPQALGDSSAAWDTYGNLFLAYVTSEGPARIVLLVSTDGGANFTFKETLATAGVEGGDVDQPTVTTGPDGAGKQSVWVSWNQPKPAKPGPPATPATEISVRGAKVSGKANIAANIGAFTAMPFDIKGSDGGNFGDIAVGPKGQVVVTYQDNQGSAGPAKIWVNTNMTGLAGASGPPDNAFGSAVLAADTKVGGRRSIPAHPYPDPNETSTGIDAEAGLAYDRSGKIATCALPGPSCLYLVYTDAPTVDSPDTNIFVRESYDDGLTTAGWSAPRQVNDTNTKSQFLPRIALDQTTGTVGFTWHDARHDGDNVKTELFGTFGISKINAAVCAVPAKPCLNFEFDSQISQGQSDYRAAQPGGQGYGDYEGAAFFCGRLFPVWGDNSNFTQDNDGLSKPAASSGKFEVYTATVLAPVVNPPGVNPVWPCGPIGGVADLLVSRSDTLSGPLGPYAAVAAAFLALGAGGWYARRRFVRR